MKARLYLSIFFFIFAATIIVGGFFLTKDFLLFVIAMFIGYIYSLVGLLFFALYLRDKIKSRVQ